ncbi:MAG: hypothetical protein IKS25_01320 [Oscillospiraceae bacterium]|nr:hypothetical protein [Oscillospiraceae bacterium]
MTLRRRITSILAALGSLLCAWLMLRMGEEGFRLVILLLGLSLIGFGLRTLFFYFTMARHMVDGRSTLYIGVLVLDFGVLTLSMSRNYGLLIVLYLLAAYAFSGVMDILRALEARSYEAGSWRLKLTEGIVNLGFAAAAVIFGLFRGDMTMLIRLYASGLIYRAILKLISAFRKTAIVYIQ